MRLFKIGFVSLLLSTISACATLHVGPYEYEAPKSSAGQYCVNRCQQAFNSCVQICALKNDVCRAELKENAIELLDDYEAKRQTRGLRKSKKTYKDFLRRATCDHSCNCVPAYNTCYRACGGKVY